MTLKDSVNETLRKIGRNMMLFQQLEHLLKFIIANGRTSGFASELKKDQAQRTSKINKQTMGQLVGQYVEHHNPDYEEGLSEPEEIEEVYFSTSFQIDSDPISYEAKKDALAKMVSERNELIHHLLPDFDASSTESCEKLGAKLDAQSENIRTEIRNLKAIIDAFAKAKKELGRFLDSEEGKRQFELIFLQRSRLIVLLRDIANQEKRPDGWTSMSTAGQVLKQHAPEEVALLKERYGHKSLKRHILASEIFDVFEESTVKGGNRVLYRIKSNYESSND